MSKPISTEEFDNLFDAGKDISAYLDSRKAMRPGLSRKLHGKDAQLILARAVMDVYAKANDGLKEPGKEREILEEIRVCVHRALEFFR